MRTLRPLLPLAALLLPAPALADVTARYRAGSAVLAVEVDDGGDARAGIDGKFALIRHGGTDYVVVYTADGVPRVIRADIALAHLRASAPQFPRKWKTELSFAGNDTVAGFGGSVRLFGPAGETGLELVMSEAPALAPVGGVFRSAAEAFAQLIEAHADAGSDPVEGVQSLFSHGTPIRVHDPRVTDDVLALQSVSHDEIDAHRFDLPGPVLTLEAFLAATKPQPQNVMVPDDVPLTADDPATPVSPPKP